MNRILQAFGVAAVVAALSPAAVAREYGSIEFIVPVLPGPPELAPIPGTDAWFYTGPEHELFFLGGWWWTRQAGAWYRAPEWEGPWAYTAPALVPEILFGLPSHYRALYGDRPRYGYPEWRERFYRERERERFEDRERDRDRERIEERERERERERPRLEELDRGAARPQLVPLDRGADRDRRDDRDNPRPGYRPNKPRGHDRDPRDGDDGERHEHHER